MISSRDIELRIRTRDLTGGSLDAITAKTAELANEFERLNRDTAAGVNNTSEFREAMQTLGREIDRQAVALAKLNADQDRHIRKRDELSARLVKETADMERVRQQYERTNNTTLAAQQTLERYSTSIAKIDTALQQENAQIEKNNALLTQAGLSTRNLVQNDEELNRAIGQSNVLLRQMEQTILSVPRRSREASAALKEQAQAVKNLAAEEARRAALVQQAADSITTAQAKQADARTKREAEFSQMQMRLATFGRQQAEREETRRAEFVQRANDSILTAQKRQFDERTRREQEFSQMQMRLANFRRTQDEQAAARAKAAADRAEASIQAATKRQHDERTRREREFSEIQQRLEQFRQRQIRQTGDMLERQARQRAGGTGAAAGGTNLNRIGLRPDQMTNLTYQGFDIVQQLGSGQAPGIIALQQGSQILQLFASHMGTLIRLSPILAVAIGTVTIAVMALSRALRDAESTRGFNAMIGITGTGSANLTGQAVTDMRNRLVGSGIDYTASGAIARTAIPAGMRSVEDIEELAKAAEGLRRSLDLKEPVEDVFKTLMEGLRGGREGILDLAKTYKVLETEELQQIMTLFDQNKALEAGELAWRLVTEKAVKYGEQAKGPVTQALISLNDEWNKFLRSLTDSGTADLALKFMVAFVKSIEGAVVALGWLNKQAAEFVGYFKQLPEWSKYFIPGGVGLALAGRDAYNAVTGTPAAGTGTPGTMLNPNKVELGDGTMKRLAELVVEGSAALPPGYNIRLLSGHRPGATVAGTDRPSQHASANAIDYDIVGPGGRVLPGAQRRHEGTVDPLYQRMEEAIAEAARKRSMTVSQGGAFGDPDYGHISMGAAEGGGTGTRPSRVRFAPTPEENTRARELLEIQKEQLAIQATANTKEAQRNEELRIRRELEKSMPGPTRGEGGELTEVGRAREEAVALQMAAFNRRIRQEQLSFEQQIVQMRITDGIRFNEIYQAGLAHAQKMNAALGGQISLEQQHANILAGMNEKRAEFARKMAEDEDTRQIRNTIAGLQRQAQSKDYTDLEERLKAVDNQFVAVNNQIARFTEKRGVRPDIISEDELNKLKETLKALEQINFQQDKTNSLIKDRNAQVETSQTRMEAGAISLGEHQDNVKKIFEDTGPAIKSALDEFEAFVRASKDIDPTKAQALLAQIEKLRAQSEYISPLWKTIRDTFNESFSSGLATAFDTVAESIGGLINKTKTWGDVLKSARDAALNFFGQLLRDIAMAIIRMEALKIATAITGGSGGSEGGGLISAGLKLLGIGASAATGVPVATGTGGLYHGGGIAGRTPVPTVPVHWLSQIPRYHNGTVVGLNDNEQLAILKRNEEVLTEDNPRHAFNASAGSAGPSEVNIRSILVDDPERVPAAMASSRGERIVIQHLVRNAATVRQLVK